MSCAGKICPSLVTLDKPTDRSGSEWLHSMWLRYRLALQRRRQRRALRQFDDHQLADIGVSREQARREAEKWFWM